MTIIFDLDGTLLDIAAKYYAVYSAIMSEVGSGPLDFETYWQMKRSGKANDEILQKGGCPLSLELYRSKFAELVERKQYLDLDKLNPGTEQTLAFLSKINQLILVTLRKNRTTLLEQLGFLGLDRCFNKIINDSTKAITPSWEKKKLFFIRYTDDKSTTVIGDSEADIKAGKELGFKTIAITCGIRSEHVLAPLGPDHIFPDIIHVLPYFKDTGK